MIENTTAPAEGQTPAQTEEIVQTPAPKEEKKEELMPKSIVTKMMKDQAAEFTKKLKALEEKASKLDELEKAKLSDEEKKEARLKKLEEVISEKDKELSGANLKLAKMEALLNAGAEPAQITKLLKRVSGTTPEEIESDVSELKEMGWIGKKEIPLPEPLKALGTQTKTGEDTKPKTVKEQRAELDARMRDSKLTVPQREALARESIRLGLMELKGDVDV